MPMDIGLRGCRRRVVNQAAQRKKIRQKSPSPGLGRGVDVRTQEVHSGMGAGQANAS